jgi:hypothetical protein
MLTIDKLAKATDTKVVTVRYYEQAGLLPVPPRTPSNYRAIGADRLVDELADDRKFVV